MGLRTAEGRFGVALYCCCMHSRLDCRATYVKSAPWFFGTKLALFKDSFPPSMLVLSVAYRHCSAVRLEPPASSAGEHLDKSCFDRFIHYYPECILPSFMCRKRWRCGCSESRAVWLPLRDQGVGLKGALAKSVGGAIPDFELLWTFRRICVSAAAVDVLALVLSCLRQS
jgi:hypothetical protein